MKNGDVAAPGGRIRERPHVGPQVVVYRERVDVRLVSLTPEHSAHPTGAVSDGVAAMGRGHPLVDDHRSDLGAGVAGPGIRDLGSGFGVVPAL
jgi:hypothetical protein